MKKKVLSEEKILEVKIRGRDMASYIFVAWNWLEKKSANKEISDILFAEYTLDVMRLHSPRKIRQIARKIYNKKYKDNKIVN